MAFSAVGCSLLLFFSSHSLCVHFLCFKKLPSLLKKLLQLLFANCMLACSLRSALCLCSALSAFFTLFVRSALLVRCAPSALFALFVRSALAARCVHVLRSALLL